MGVSYRRLLGWEPTRTTVHYDTHGNRVGVSVTTTEAEWDSDQHAIAVALTAVRNDACPGCGQPRSLSTSPSSAGDDESSHMYTTDPPVRCHSCTARDAAIKQHQTAGGDPANLHFPVRRVENWRTRRRRHN